MADLAAARAAIDRAYERTGGRTPKAPLELTDVRFIRKRLIEISEALEPSPAPTPPPAPSSFWDAHYAIVVNAVNCDAALLRQAGVTHVAFEINPPNISELPTEKWAGFRHGGFYSVRGLSVEAALVEAAALSWHLTYNVDFLVIDTEWWKADSLRSHAPDADGLAIQEAFYAELRRLAPDARIANITYGWHQDGSVVNHEALRRHRIEPWWEAYNGDEASWNTRAVCEKLNAQGYRPARLCLGHSRLESQVPEWQRLVAEGKAARGAMLWDVSLGPPQNSLRAGVRLP